MSGKSGAGCLKGLGIGCGSCLLLTVIVAGSIWAGWGTIRTSGPFRKLTSTFEAAKSEAVNMTALRTSLNESYPAARIDVRADIQSRDGVTVKTLAVALVNPGFEVPESDAAREQTARSVAKRIAELYPTLDVYDQLRIAFVLEGDGGARLGSTSTFQYATAELLGGAPEPATAAPTSR